MTAPRTRAARLHAITQVLNAQPVRSQAELAHLLSAQGIAVTQATLSRDLVEIGAVRSRAADGSLVYRVNAAPSASTLPTSAQRLERAVSELVLDVQASGNIVVVHTPPGGAQFLASAIDGGEVPGVMGTVAGDDTVLLVSQSPDGGGAVVEYLVSLTTSKGSNL